jgi:hypothetical protein
MSAPCGIPAWRRGLGARAKVQLLYLSEATHAEFTRVVLASEDLIALCEDPAYTDKENRGEFAALPALGDFVRGCLAEVGVTDFGHGDVVIVGKQPSDAADAADAPDARSEVAVDMLVFDDGNTWDAAVSLLGSVHSDPEFEGTRVIPTSVTDGLCNPLLFYSGLHGPPYNFKDQLFVEMSTRHPVVLAALASGLRLFEGPKDGEFVLEHYAFAVQSAETLAAAAASASVSAFAVTVGDERGLR